MGNPQEDGVGHVHEMFLPELCIFHVQSLGVVDHIALGTLFQVFVKHCVYTIVIADPLNYLFFAQLKFSKIIVPFFPLKVVNKLRTVCVLN